MAIIRSLPRPALSSYSIPRLVPRQFAWNEDKTDCMKPLCSYPWGQRFLRESKSKPSAVMNKFVRSFPHCDGNEGRFAQPWRNDIDFDSDVVLLCRLT